MIEPELRQLQQVLNQKADAVQREFVAVSEQLHVLGRQLVEARGEDEEPIRAEQAALREKQQALAVAVNEWRDRARAVLRQPGDEALERFLDELSQAGDEAVRAAVEVVLYARSHPEEAVAARERARSRTGMLTPASRLLERARTEYDLRGVEPAPRQRAAVEFANRPGMAQNDEVLAALEAALDDPDPLTREVMVLTAIQMHRFRALRLSELDAAHVSVQRLARLKHPAVIPVLIEILATPRTGFVPGQGPGGMVEANNLQSRLVALASLVEWRTPQAQAAVRARQHDRDPRMAAAASRALEVFPGDWQ
jgi:hypothetical protein